MHTRYHDVKIITVAMFRVTNSGTLNHSLQEHVTGTLTSGLLSNYFSLETFIITPEQIQRESNKKPDFTVERLEGYVLYPHIFVEIKGLRNPANFDKILDQQEEAILGSVDIFGTNLGDYAVFTIAMKGTRIAFYEYFSYVSELNEKDVFNYNGFIPLNYRMSESEFQRINNQLVLNESAYLGYLTEIANHIPLGENNLLQLGVEKTECLNYPHIWDLNNSNHRPYIHHLFCYMANNLPGKNIKD